jgi:hypothetical protein
MGIMASAITGNLGLSVDYLVVAGGAGAVHKVAQVEAQVDFVLL